MVRHTIAQGLIAAGLAASVLLSGCGPESQYRTSPSCETLSVSLMAFQSLWERGDQEFGGKATVLGDGSLCLELEHFGLRVEEGLIPLSISSGSVWGRFKFWVHSDLTMHPVGVDIESNLPCIKAREEVAAPSSDQEREPLPLLALEFQLLVTGLGGETRDGFRTLALVRSRIVRFMEAQASVNTPVREAPIPHPTPPALSLGKGSLFTLVFPDERLRIAYPWMNTLIRLPVPLRGIWTMATDQDHANGKYPIYTLMHGFYYPGTKSPSVSERRLKPARDGL